MCVRFRPQPHFVDLGVDIALGSAHRAALGVVEILGPEFVRQHATGFPFRSFLFFFLLDYLLRSI